jgi:hypothetical protein
MDMGKTADTVAVSETPLSGKLMYGLLVVQIIVGFEFFWTVLGKIVRGGFVSGLGADLQDRVQAAPGWYQSFADNVVIPNARTFAFTIIIGELFVGLGLMVAGIIWLWRWNRITTKGRIALAAVSAAAALAGMAMNVNYHIASGSSNPWRIPTEVFDEGVDLNSILPMIELTILVVMVGIALAIWRNERRPAGAL